MRLIRRSCVLSLGLGLALSAASQAPAMGLDWVPTAYVIETVPTSYAAAYSYPNDVVPTSYVTYPTSYVSPAAYVPTSYVLSPTYAYVRPRALRRNLVATSYGYGYGYGYGVVPAVVVPTVLTTPRVLATQSVTETVLASACDPCGVQPPCCSSASSTATAPAPVAPKTSPTSGRATPSTVESMPAGGAPATAVNDTSTTRRDTIPATGRPAATAPAPAPASSAADPNFSSPPDVPAHDKDAPAPAPAPAAAPATDKNKYTPISPPDADSGTLPPAAPVAPVAPGGEAAAAPVELAPASEATPPRYQVQKPVGPMPPPSPAPYVRSVARGDLNTLQGKVISSETGLPEAGVQLSLANRLGNYVERVVTTDASGGYSVSLPDGDWTVNVTMPSGRVYAVSRLKVSQGQVHDDLGRDIPTLIINR